MDQCVCLWLPCTEFSQSFRFFCLFQSLDRRTVLTAYCKYPFLVSGHISLTETRALSAHGGENFYVLVSNFLLLDRPDKVVGFFSPSSDFVTFRAWWPRKICILFSEQLIVSFLTVFVISCSTRSAAGSCSLVRFLSFSFQTHWSLMLGMILSILFDLYDDWKRTDHNPGYDSIFGLLLLHDCSLLLINLFPFRPTIVSRLVFATVQSWLASFENLYVYPRLTVRVILVLA